MTTRAPAVLKQCNINCKVWGGVLYDLFIPALFPIFVALKNPNSPIHVLSYPITRQYCHSFSFSLSKSSPLIHWSIFPRLSPRHKNLSLVICTMQYVLLNKLSSSTQIMRGTPTQLARGLVAPGGLLNPPVCFTWPMCKHPGPPDPHGTSCKDHTGRSP